jgi:hypothetical protein
MAPRFPRWALDNTDHCPHSSTHGRDDPLEVHAGTQTVVGNAVVPSQPVLFSARAEFHGAARHHDSYTWNSALVTEPVLRGLPVSEMRDRRTGAK